MGLSLSALGRGTRIRFAFPENGYEYDQRKAAKYLEVGEVYTVEGARVESFSSAVRVQEVPGHWFNTVLFEDCRVSAKAFVLDRYPRSVCRRRPVHEHEMYGEYSVWPATDEDGKVAGRALGAGNSPLSAWNDAAARLRGERP